MNVSETKITQALKTRGTISLANTVVEYSVTSEVSKVHLHGNQIAEYNHEKKELKINFCGYASNTTRSRINAICEALGFQQWFTIRGGVPYLNTDRLNKEPIHHSGWYVVAK